MDGWNKYLIEFAAFAGASGVAMYVMMYLLGRHERRLDRRAEELTEESDRDGGRQQTRSNGLTSLFETTVPKFATQLLPDDPDERTKLQNRLIQAGYTRKLDVVRFLVIRLALMVAPLLICLGAGLAGFFDVQTATMVGAIIGTVGLIVPGLWLDRKKTRRQMVLCRSLPDFLDLLVTCVESGLSLDASLRRVTSELRHAHPVLASEMERVQSEMDLGATADAALHHLADRSDIESIRTLGTFLKQARRLGTSIAEALRTHAEMLRSQRELRAEEMAQKAAVKILFPTLLFIFPSVFVVLAGPAAIQLNEKFSKPGSEANSEPSP